MNKYAVFFKEEGVIAIGTETAYGMDIRYFMEGIEFFGSCEEGEYIVLGELDEDI